MTDNRTTEQRISKPLLGFIKHQRNRGYIDAGQAQWLFNIADEIDAKHEQAIAATLGSNTKPCYATDYTHDHCKYSVNRGWVEDTRFFIPTAELGGGTLTAEQAIAATLGSEPNPNGLPNGLTISDDGALLNWRGENYVKQSTLGGGTLTAEQVRETVEKHWHDLPDEYDMSEATALPEYSYDWQAIADELNAALGDGECELVEVDSYSSDREIIHVLECSACGETCEHVNGSYPRCPHCGRKAVKR